MLQGPEHEPKSETVDVVRHRQPLSRPEFFLRAGAVAIMLSLGVGVGVHFGTQDSVATVDKANTELGGKFDKASAGLQAANKEAQDAQALCAKIEKFGPELQALADFVTQDDQPLDGETTTTTTSTTTAPVGPPAPLTTTP